MIATLPAFTRKASTETPTIAVPTAATNAASVAGRAASSAKTVVPMSLTSSESSAAGSAPMTRAARTMPPTTGRATTTLKIASADAWITSVGQLAAAISAPRFRVRRGVNDGSTREMLAR